MHNKSSSAYKALCDIFATAKDNLVTHEEIRLMVRKFNKFYKSRGKDRSSSSRHDEKRPSSRDRNCYKCGKAGHYFNEYPTPYKRREESPRRRSSRDESPRRERRSREDHYELDTPGEERNRRIRTSTPRAAQEEDINLALVNGFSAPSLTTNLKETTTPTPTIVKMKVLPPLHSFPPTPMTYLIHQMRELETAS